MVRVVVSLQSFPARFSFFILQPKVFPMERHQWRTHDNASAVAEAYDHIGGTPPTHDYNDNTNTTLDKTDRHGILSPQTQTRDGVGFASSQQNLAEIMPYLNQSLADLNYPSPLELLLPNAGDLARTCNVLFLMLRDRQNDVTAREHAGEERRRMQ